MSLNLKETVWFYHRGNWSKLIRSRQHTQSPYARASLQGRYRRWCQLGPPSPSSSYSGIVVTVYLYTGNEKAPEYLIKVFSICRNEIIYAEDFPDVLEVLKPLALLASNGIFVDAYRQRPSTSD